MITGVGHVAFRVRDIEKSKAFYCDQLGLQHAFDMDRDGKPWIVFVYVGNHQYLELFPDAEAQPLVQSTKPSYSHLQLTVDDMERTLAELDRRGLQPANPPRTGGDGNVQAWLTDPDGNRIELMQMMPGCLHEQAEARLAREREKVAAS
jgi:lactoylglutathione lyase